MINNDHWPEIEINQIRDDLECAEVELAEAVERSEKDRDARNHWHAKFKALERNIQSKIDEANGEIIRKSLIYIDLIGEYQNLVAAYSANSMVALTTTNINKLRERGGLSV